MSDGQGDGSDPKGRVREALRRSLSSATPEQAAQASRSLSGAGAAVVAMLRRNAPTGMVEVRPFDELKAKFDMLLVAAKHDPSQGPSVRDALHDLADRIYKRDFLQGRVTAQEIRDWLVPLDRRIVQILPAGAIAQEIMHEIVTLLTMVGVEEGNAWGDDLLARFTER